jgi:lipoate-protein ligase B
MLAGTGLEGHPLTVEWRGREAFDATWAYQLRCAVELRADPEHAPDRLVFVEHEPVVTLGRHGDPANLPGGEAALAAAGMALRRIERGGDITYHGPGQLVGYPLLHLRRRGLTLRAYLRGLEEALIQALGRFAIAGQRLPGLTGVWATGRPENTTPAGPAKLAAIGVAVQGGVSFHGFALNVDPDLAHFSYIVPCGIADKPVGSMAQLLGADCPGLAAVRAVVEQEFRRSFGYAAAQAMPGPLT